MAMWQDNQGRTWYVDLTKSVPAVIIDYGDKMKTRINISAVEDVKSKGGRFCEIITDAILGLNDMIRDLREDWKLYRQNYDKLAEMNYQQVEVNYKLQERVTFLEHLLQKKSANTCPPGGDKIHVAGYGGYVQVSNDDLKLILYILENSNCTGRVRTVRLESGGFPVYERCGICDERIRLIDKLKSWLMP